MPRIENGTAMSLVKSNASVRPAIRLTMWSAHVFQPRLHRGERGRREVRLRHGAVGGMLGVVHLQQAAQHIGLAEHPLEALLGHLAGEEGARRGDEGSAPALHRRDIAVAAEQPERTHARGVDPKHRRLGAQQLERGLKPCVVGVAVGGNDEAGGLVQCGSRSPPMAATARQCAGRELALEVRDRRGTRHHSLPPFS